MRIVTHHVAFQLPGAFQVIDQIVLTHHRKGNKYRQPSHLSIHFSDTNTSVHRRST